MNKIISIGNKIDMEILIDGEPVVEKEKRRSLICKVMDFPERNVIRISMPFFEGRIVPLSVGDQYHMNFFTDKGIYASRFVVVKRLKEGNLFLADMEIQESLKKVQRREFFRYDCRIPADYRLVSPEELEKERIEEPEDVEWKKGVVLDISGGGVRMISEFQETAGALMQLRMSLVVAGELHEFLLYGKLIASIKNKTRSELYEQRVEFNQIDEKEREKIIRYIFDEQRKRILKEKGLD